MRPVGETKFVQGIAAQNASRGYGNTKIAAGIVGFADLTLGDGVTDVLESHIEAGKTDSAVFGTLPVGMRAPKSVLIKTRRWDRL